MSGSPNTTSKQHRAEFKPLADELHVSQSSSVASYTPQLVSIRSPNCHKHAEDGHWTATLNVSTSQLASFRDDWSAQLNWPA
jgi:hypothetical protein